MPRYGRPLILVLLVCVGVFFLIRELIPDTYSNIYAADYVGPDACAECHEDNHALWLDHPHRRMNQNPTEETVKGDFTGPTLEYGQGRVVFERANDDFIMSIYEDDVLIRIHKVTRTVGSVYVQYYIGKQILGPEPSHHISYQIETKLPFGYSIALDRWLPEVYLDSTMRPEADYLEAAQGDYHFEPPIHSWNRSCIYCHNTYPYVSRLWKSEAPLAAAEDIWRAGFPVESVDWRGEVYDQGKFVHPVRALKGVEIRGIGADELVTVGISCESCHFGGREHAIEEKDISFVPRSPELTIRRPGTNEVVESDRENAFVVNSICFQCHNATLERYPSNEPAVNSDEAFALGIGACASSIKCTDCHNPHERGAASGAPEQASHIEACLKCHENHADNGYRSRHTRHSAQVSCLDCHMPRIVSGLDTVVRSHAISIPGDPRMIRQGSLNACNLCHLERPISWTLAKLERGWGRRSVNDDEVGQWGVYGSDDMSPVGEAWLQSSDQHTRAAAVDAYSRTPLNLDRAPFLIEGLRDDHAFNRTVALIALESVLGRPVSRQEYDLVAGEAERNEQLRTLLSSLRWSEEPTDPL